MSKFLSRNVKTSEAAERPKDGGRLLTKRGSFDSDKVNLLLSSSMSNYNDPLPPFCNTANKFFASTKASEAQTLRKSHKSSSVSRGLNSSQDQPRSDLPKHWEIIERIETLEIRLSQNPETSPNSKLLLWKNCSTDVISLIKRENSELATILNRLVKGFLVALEEISLEFQAEQSKKSKTLQDQKETIKAKSEQIQNLTTQIRDMQEVKLAQEWKIAEEIRELFEQYDDEDEIDIARARCNALLRTKPTTIVPLLKEVYDSLRKNREVPDLRDDPDNPHPDDISKALQFNFSRMLHASTKKAMSLLKKDIKTKLVSTQTVIACVSAEEYQELMKKLEKALYSQQVLQTQTEKYREEVISRINISEKAEVEKNQAFTQMMKSKKEADVYLKELTALKREHEKIVNEKEKTAKELEDRTGKLNKAQDRLGTLENRVRKLTAKVSVGPGQSYQEEERPMLSVSRQPSEKEFLNVNIEGPKYVIRPNRPGMEERKGSKTNLYDTKPFIYEKNLGKKQMSKSSYSSRSSLVDDYIEFMNKPANPKPVADVKAQKRKSSVFAHEMLPVSKGTDAPVEPKSELEYHSPSNNRKKSLKINIIQPSELDEGFEKSDEKSGTKKKKEKKDEKKKVSSGKRSSASEFVEQGTGRMETRNEIVLVQRTVVRDGKNLVVMDQSTSTSEKMTTFCSVSIQCGQNEEEEKEGKGFGSSFGMFHFNPNNYFGFRGDVFYQGGGKVFAAQPCIPDTTIIVKKD